MFRSAATVREPQSAAQEFTIVKASGVPRPLFYIPQRFSDAILLHLVKNTLDQLMAAPLLLLIQGPPGEGKSAQTLEVCARHNVDLVIMAGFALSGRDEKEPVQVLRSAYLQASSMKQLTARRVAFLIEDLDTSIAVVHADRQYTVNTQLVNGALMRLCQDPYHFGDVHTERIPIIATGNNFTGIYAPLLRHGRSVFLDWVPDRDARVDIVRTMLEPYLPESELARVPILVDHFTQQSPPASTSFYEQLRDSVFDGVILETIHRTGKMDLGEIDRAVAMTMPSLTIETLIDLGDRLRATGPHDYLA